MDHNGETPTLEKTASGLALKYASKIQNKIILITGVSQSGLGAAFARAVALSQPALLILAGRNLAKVEESKRTIEESTQKAGLLVEVRPLELDLSSFASVRTAAGIVNSWDDVAHIDVLVNNAGIMAVDYAISPDGYEKHFATNHLGPFLFTNLLMGKILNSSAPRIVVVSSEGHGLCPIRFHDLNFENGKAYNRWQGYGQSKTANMLMALSLANKLGGKRGLQVYSLHPGVIQTHLGDHINWEVEFTELLAVFRVMGGVQATMSTFPFVSLDEGAATHVYAAFDPELAAHNGAYLLDCRVADPNIDAVRPWATSLSEAERLWKLSEGLVGQSFDY